MYEIALSVVIYYYIKIQAFLGERVSEAHVECVTSFPVRHWRPAKKKPPDRNEFVREGDGAYSHVCAWSTQG